MLQKSVQVNRKILATPTIHYTLRVYSVLCTLYSVYCIICCEVISHPKLCFCYNTQHILVKTFKDYLIICISFSLYLATLSTYITFSLRINIIHCIYKSPRTKARHSTPALQVNASLYHNPYSNPTLDPKA